jgi:hypothetical protein
MLQWATNGLIDGEDNPRPGNPIVFKGVPPSLYIVLPMSHWRERRWYFCCVCSSSCAIEGTRTALGHAASKFSSVPPRLVITGTVSFAVSMAAECYPNSMRCSGCLTRAVVLLKPSVVSTCGRMRCALAAQEVV